MSRTTIATSLCAILCCLLLTSCGSPFSVSSTTVSTVCIMLNYTIPTYPAVPAQGLHQKPGDMLTIAWQAQQPSLSSASGSTVQFAPIQQAVMQEQLFGPFPSLAAVNQINTSNPNAARGSLVASSTPIVTKTCTPRTYKSTLTLPRRLQPGYYDLYLSGSIVTANGNSGFSSDIPIHVTK